jgi:hypothetical protein
MIDGGAAIVPRELAPEDPVSVPPKPDDPVDVPPKPDVVSVPPKPDDPVIPAEPAEPAGVPVAVVIAAPCASTVVADGAMIDAGAAIVPTKVAPADDTAGTVQPIMPGVVLVDVPIVMPVVVPVVMPVVVPIMPAVAPVVITAVAAVVMLVVEPGVRPKGQGPVRLLVVVPAGKGDMTGMGIGEGSDDPRTPALVPVKVPVAAPALLAATAALVPAPIINKPLVLALVWLMVPLAAVAALLALVVLLVGLISLVMPLAALLAPVVPLVGLIAMLMLLGALVVCALATPGTPSSSAVTAGKSLIAFMQHPWISVVMWLWRRAELERCMGACPLPP